jgi:predicted nucleotidyltransferase
MASNVQADAVLREVREALCAHFGDRLSRLILYGSRARGNAEPDSDFDVLIVLQEFDSSEAELARINETISDLSLRHDAVVCCSIVRDTDYERASTPLLLNVQREGVGI